MPQPKDPNSQPASPELQRGEQAGFVSVVILLVLAALIFLGGVVVYQKVLAPKVNSTPTPIIAPSPTSDPTADWKTYTNTKYGFETKHYPALDPNEFTGNNEGIGQFTYSFLVNFGTNPIKSQHGYELRVAPQRSLDNFRTELVGHMTDKIDSTEEIIINGNAWTRINYQIFLTTDYVPMTTAFINHGKYNFAITSSSLEVDQTLSTFKFLD